LAWSTSNRGVSALEPSTKHNARHLRDPDFQCLFASVPKVREFSSRNQAIFGPNSLKATV
jgi:hypothetical protein